MGIGIFRVERKTVESLQFKGLGTSELDVPYS